MLRLDQIYVRNFFAIFLTTFILIGALAYVVLEKMEIGNHRVMLLHLIDAVELSEKKGEALEKMVHRLHQDTGVRITMVDPNGRVYIESNRDPKGMQNHLMRPEIQSALKEGIGSAVRHSATLGKDFLYVAKHIGDHFVRMAYPLEGIKEKFMTFWLKSIGLFGVASALLLWLAMRTNKKVTNDLRHIESTISKLLDKEYEVSFYQSSSKEFQAISNQIEKVAKKLQKREKQKRKYTKKLKLLNQKQSDIISAISHEFKNPIAAITGYAQTIREDRDLNPQIREKFLDKILSNAHKISDMIDRLSMAIKLENDTSIPQMKNFGLDKLIVEVVENLQQKYPEREIVTKLEAVQVRADRTMFDNLLTNLIENALKYSEDEVEITLDQERLSVKDHGVGIPKEQIDHITQKFFRVDNLSWDNSIGVGLYISKYVLKLHNIDLKIESEVGKGSRFWFAVSALKS